MDCIIFDAAAFEPALEEEYNGDDDIAEDEDHACSLFLTSAYVLQP